MKVFLMTDRFPPEQTTVGKIVLGISKQLLTNGHSVGVITTTRERAEDGESVYDGVAVYKVYADYGDRWRSYLSLYNPQTVIKVRTILREHHPDIVYAHNIHHYLSYFCLKLAKQSGAKVFLTAHDVMLFHYGKLVEFINPQDLSCLDTFDYHVSAWQQIEKFKKRYNPFRNVIIRHYLHYVDKVFAVSDALMRALNQNGIQNVEVMHNGIDVDEWQVSQVTVEKFKEEHGLRGKRVVLFGGRLSEAKGGRQAVLAMQRVIEKIPDALLLIMGERNRYAETMLDIAKGMGIDSNIVFTGWISGDELRAAYHSCDVLLSSSICFETFGMVCLEAMACRKPVIATCFGGPREIVIDGLTGYVINPFNTTLLANRIVELLTDEKKAKQFGEAGYNRIEKKFDLRKQTESLLRW